MTSLDPGQCSFFVVLMGEDNLVSESVQKMYVYNTVPVSYGSGSGRGTCLHGPGPGASGAAQSVSNQNSSVAKLK